MHPLDYATERQRRLDDGVRAMWPLAVDRPNSYEADRLVESFLQCLVVSLAIDAMTHACGDGCGHDDEALD